MFQKLRFTSLLIVASVTFAVPVCAAAEIRANYEIEVKSEGDSYSIRTSEAIGDDGVISQELGSFRIVLSPSFGVDGRYELEVSVTRIAESATSIAPAASRSYRGSLGGPLEFSGGFGGAVVSGAIIIQAAGGDS